MILLFIAAGMLIGVSLIHVRMADSVEQSIGNNWHYLASIFLGRNAISSLRVLPSGDRAAAIKINPY
jgi:hypothetical protein